MDDWADMAILHLFIEITKTPTLISEGKDGLTYFLWIV